MNVEALHKRLDEGPWTQEELNDRIRAAASIPEWDNAGVSGALAMLQTAGGVRRERVGDEPPYTVRFVKTEFPRPLSDSERLALHAKRERQEQDRADEMWRTLHTPPPVTYAGLNRQERDMVEVVLRHHGLIT